MKKQLVKHMLHSTAALMLCAAMLTGLPFTGTPAPGGDNGGKPGIIGEIPGGDGEGESGEEPGIAPQSDQPPKINLPTITPED